MNSSRWNQLITFKRKKNFKHLHALTFKPNTTENAADTSVAAGFDGLLRQFLTAAEGQNVSEEELFAALVQERIQAVKGDQAAEEFGALLSQEKASMTRSDGYVPC